MPLTRFIDVSRDPCTMKSFHFARAAAAVDRRCPGPVPAPTPRSRTSRIPTGAADRQGRRRSDRHGAAGRQEHRQLRSDAIIFSTRLDMAPDGMQEMATKVTPMPGTEPAPTGSRRPSAWPATGNCRSVAKVQGETGSVENSSSSRPSNEPPLPGSGPPLRLPQRQASHGPPAALPPRPMTAAIVSAAQAAENAAPIYYRDPDGKSPTRRRRSRRPTGATHLPVFRTPMRNPGELEQPATARSPRP